MSGRTVLNRPGYKSPILPEATVHNGVVYCAGKVGLDPVKGTLVSDDVGEQTVSTVSKRAGSVKLTMILESDTQFAQAGACYRWKRFHKTSQGQHLSHKYG